MVLVYPLERLGQAEVPLPLADGGHVGGRRRLRGIQPGTGVEWPSRTIADEEHQPAEILRVCPVTRHRIVKTFQPVKRLVSYRCHRGSVHVRGPGHVINSAACDRFAPGGPRRTLT
ncbi:hypothetical protein GCM10027615_71970 [Plantactinospora veratri]